jgi:putative addiction module killer protein
MIYEIERTKTYVKWFDRLKDIRAKGRIKARIENAYKGNLGDCVPEGGDVRAMRIDYGPGYRLYFTIRGNKLIILLCGGDKRTQKKDIKKAQKLSKEIV